MINKFQTLVKNILENNTSGAGGVFGTPQIPVYNPPDQITSGDNYAKGDARNIFGGVFTKKTNKKKKKKKTPLVIKRNLQRNSL